jgi:tetratricopeptide (TPR) repeat protein
MYAGALRELDQLLHVIEATDPVLPGSQRSDRPTPITSVTAPLRLAVRAAAGASDPGDRHAIDATIARLEAIPEPQGAVVRRQSAGMAYAAYLITGNPKYVDAVRRWSGRAPPLVLQARMALAAADTTRAAQLAARFPPPDTARLVTPPDELRDPLSEAAVLSTVGQHRAALAVLESLDPSSFKVAELDPRWAMYAQSVLGRAQLHEQLGDRDLAIAAYERYLALIRDADPTLQAEAQGARTKLLALRDASRSQR